MLIPLPVACALIALVSDVVAAASGGTGWHFMGYVLTIGTWVTGLLAAVPGIADYLFVVPGRTQAKRHATIHLLLNLAVVGLFVASWLIKNAEGPAASPAPTIILEVIAVSLLAVSGWLGWTLVYKHRLGVDEESEGPSRLRKVA
jgi:uncharacterized membrane protein